MYFEPYYPYYKISSWCRREISFFFSGSGRTGEKKRTRTRTRKQFLRITSTNLSGAMVFPCNWNNLVSLQEYSLKFSAVAKEELDICHQIRLPSFPDVSYRIRSREQGQMINTSPNSPPVSNPRLPSTSPKKTKWPHAVTSMQRLLLQGDCHIDYGHWVFQVIRYHGPDKVSTLQETGGRGRGPRALKVSHGGLYD